MELVISNCNDKNFIDYIINKLQEQIISSLNVAKLYRLDQYINSLSEYKSKYREDDITCQDIVIEGSNNLKAYKVGANYHIGINKNKKLNGLNVKIIDACNLINYGALGVPAYPIFTQSFKYIDTNLNLLYLEYRGM